MPDGVGAGPPRLLLVSQVPAWREAVAAAASSLDAGMETVPDVPAALRRLLAPAPLCTHLLASGPLSMGEAEAMAGMADEITRRSTPLLLLGGAAAGDDETRRLIHPDPAAIAAAVREASGVAPPPALPMSREEVRAGLNRGHLRMRFQPLVRAGDLLPVGVESLARLYHPARGILYPEAFVPQAVACGQERVFTGIMGARAMLDLKGLGLGLAGLRFSLNLPIPAFWHELTVERALTLAAVMRLDPARVAIEVLETEDAPDLARLAAAVARWRRAGFAVLIDDAGPALPHWRALVDMPFSGIKLDRGLAVPAMRGAAAEIADHARRRGMEVIAEGIESPAALAQAREIGADALQGFLISRPLPAMALPLWLEDWRAAGRG